MQPLATLIATLAATAAVALAAPVEAAPMEVLPSGHPIAEVSIRGSQKLRFIIDTAASSTSILPRLRAAMADTLKTVGNQSLSGAAGQTEITTLAIERLSVDGREFQKLTAFALPPSPVDDLGVDGVLGADVIARFAVEMDMPGRSWQLAESATPAMLEGMLPAVPITLDEALTPRLSVEIEGVSVPAILDTGAKGTIMNWAAARSIGLTPDSKRIASASQVQGVTTHGTNSGIATFDDFRIGAMRKTGVSLRIADLPVFGALGFKDGEPAIIIGIDALADRRFVIDHPGKRLFISAAGGPATPAAAR